MRIEFEAAKNREGVWGVYGIQSRTFNFLGKGKRFCTKKADELNKYSSKNH